MCWAGLPEQSTAVPVPLVPARHVLYLPSVYSCGCLGFGAHQETGIAETVDGLGVCVPLGLTASPLGKASLDECPAPKGFYLH
mmetsp:Transcript_117074/g.203825  ORF Transcript_117074/g.203825 Transcript_117074/m.203825 type:complete len:83 (+) Transcript_117074:1967-2215(+)